MKVIGYWVIWIKVNDVKIAGLETISGNWSCFFLILDYLKTVLLVNRKNSS